MIAIGQCPIAIIKYTYFRIPLWNVLGWSVPGQKERSGQLLTNCVPLSQLNFSIKKNKTVSNCDRSNYDSWPYEKCGRLPKMKSDKLYQRNADKTL